MTPCFTRGQTRINVMGLQGAASNQSLSETSRASHSPDHGTFLNHKVLRFCQEGRSSSTRLTRISSDFLSRNSLAAKGDVLIHGPCLVARPVGSEWRTQRPFHVSNQTNHKGDRTR
jgi:hypothetical protein